MQRKLAKKFGKRFCTLVRDIGIRHDFCYILGLSVTKGEANLHGTNSISPENLPLFRLIIVEAGDEACRLILDFMMRHRDCYKLTDKEGKEIFSSDEDFSKYYDLPGGWIDLYSVHPRAENYDIGPINSIYKGSVLDK